MKDMTPMSMVSLMPGTTDEIKSFANKFLTQVSDGEVDPIKAIVALKAIQKTVETVIDDKEFKRLVRAAADNYEGKIFERFGAEIEKCEVGTKYDYSKCGHEEYNEVMEKFRFYEAKKKEFEEFLKGVKIPTPMIIFGEAVTINPPKKSSTSSVKISFK